MSNTPVRQAHATLDLVSRQPKALKIERLLHLADHKQPFRLLEIGCGSGGISHYFATHPDLKCQVTAVDVHDNRQVHDGFDYQQVEGVILPFGPESFDVVISNHVIEHVGDRRDQLKHLAEIRRVLKAAGVGYLAVPNRWMLTEPHYRLKFLSWWPRPWRSSYLRFMRKGDHYDCEPFKMRELEKMITAADLKWHNLALEATRLTLEIEYAHSVATRLLAGIPDVVLRPLKPLIPTLVYRLERLGRHR